MKNIIFTHFQIIFFFYKARNIFINQEKPEPFTVINPSKTNNQYKNLQSQTKQELANNTKPPQTKQGGREVKTNLIS